MADTDSTISKAAVVAGIGGVSTDTTAGMTKEAVIAGMAPAPSTGAAATKFVMIVGMSPPTSRPRGHLLLLM
jgi:hypothetical protein